MCRRSVVRDVVFSGFGCSFAEASRFHRWEEGERARATSLSREPLALGTNAFFPGFELELSRANEEWL